MPKGGLEPPRPCGHCALNAARIPISPLRRLLMAHQVSRIIEPAQQCFNSVPVILISCFRSIISGSDSYWQYCRKRDWRYGLPHVSYIVKSLFQQQHLSCFCQAERRLRCSGNYDKCRAISILKQTNINATSLNKSSLM